MIYGTKFVLKNGRASKSSYEDSGNASFFKAEQGSFVKLVVNCQCKLNFALVKLICHYILLLLGCNQLTLYFHVHLIIS